MSSATTPLPATGKRWPGRRRSMVLINRLSRSNGVKTVRNSNALVTKIAVKPTLSTIASDRSTSAEMVAGDSTRAKVPAMNTAPLIRQTRQYSGSVVGVVTSSAYEDRKWVLARIDRRQEIVETRLHGTVHLILLAAFVFLAINP